MTQMSKEKASSKQEDIEKINFSGESHSLVSKSRDYDGEHNNNNSLEEQINPQHSTCSGAMLKTKFR